MYGTWSMEELEKESENKKGILKSFSSKFRELAYKQKNEKSSRKLSPDELRQKLYQEEEVSKLLKSHYNYSKVKEIIANKKLLDLGEYSPSTRAFEKLGIGRGSANNNLNRLVDEGWLDKVCVGEDNPRNYRYRILVSREEAEKFKEAHYIYRKKILKNLPNAR